MQEVSQSGDDSIHTRRGPQFRLASPPLSNQSNERAAAAGGMLTKCYRI